MKKGLRPMNVMLMLRMLPYWETSPDEEGIKTVLRREGPEQVALGDKP